MVLVLLAALVDLVLPAQCAGCAAPAPPLCPRCTAPLAGPAQLSWPDPAPPGLPPPWAVAPYAGPVRAALLQHKERGRAALAEPLGAALASALVAAARGAATGGVPLVAVPVPSSARARRARGEDPLLRLSRRAVRIAAAQGVPARLVPALRQRPGVHDQAGLSVRQRADNLRGALVVTSRAAPLLRGAAVVVLDDVLTTGATLGEAGRALRAVGAAVHGAAVVAATPRRRVGVPALSVPGRRD